MSPKECKKILFEAISRHENTGSNELFEIIISEYGKIFSRPTFLKYLNELEREDEISIVRETGRQDYVITTFSKAQEVLNRFVEEFDIFFTRLEHYLNLMEKNVNQMSDDEKAECLVALIRSIQFEDWLISDASGFKNMQQKTLSVKLHDFRHKVTQLMISCSPSEDQFKIFHLVSKQLIEESHRPFSLYYSLLNRKFT